MRHVHQGDVVRADGVQDVVVTPIGGYQHIGSGARSGAHQLAARTAADRDPAHRALRRTGGTYPARRGGQRGRHPRAERAEWFRFGQVADAAQSAVTRLGPGRLRAGRLRASRLGEWPDVAQPEDPRERVTHTGAGHIGVGVRAEQRHAPTDEGCHDPATRVGLRDTVNTAEKQRMMGDQKLRTATNGFPCDVECWVNGEQCMVNRHLRVSDREPHSIPRLRPGRRIAAVELGNTVSHGAICCGHRPDTTQP